MQESLQKMTLIELQALARLVASEIERRKIGLVDFVVYRYGSNSANQPMTWRAIVWTGKAEDDSHAVRLAQESGVRCYPNQYLAATPVSELVGADLGEYRRLLE